MPTANSAKHLSSPLLSFLSVRLFRLVSFATNSEGLHDALDWIVKNRTAPDFGILGIRYLGRVEVLIGEDFSRRFRNWKRKMRGRKLNEKEIWNIIGWILFLGERMRRVVRVVRVVDCLRKIGEIFITRVNFKQSSHRWYWFMMELSLTEKGWWNGFYRWWKRSIWTKGQFNSIRSVEAFKCFVAWVAGNLRPDRLNNVAYRCISAPNVFPSFFVPSQNYPYHRNSIEVMILDFKYFIKTYFINDFLLFLSSKFKLDTFATICFLSLFRIYRAHIISRYTDNNAGTLIFQHPESIVFLFFFFSYSSRPDISKWIFLFFELRAKIFFLSFPLLFFSPHHSFVMLTSSIA